MALSTSVTLLTLHVSSILFSMETRNVVLVFSTRDMTGEECWRCEHKGAQSVGWVKPGAILLCDKCKDKVAAGSEIVKQAAAGKAGK